ncbi:MAG: RodZ domain-containing protein [Casimicrobiaceae bacterium]
MADEDTPPPIAATSPIGAGAMLAHARDEAALSVDTVAAQLKLAPRQVRALESGDFAALPGRTFVRGFVRNYARLLGIDAANVLAALPADNEPGLRHPHLASTQRVMGEIPAEHARRRSFAGWAIALALVAIIAVAVLYEIIREQRVAATEPAKPGRPAASAPAVEAAPQSPAAPEGRALPNPMAPAPQPAPVTAPSSGAASVDTKLAANLPLAAGSRTAADVSATPAATTAATTRAAAAADSHAAIATMASAVAAKASTLQVIFRGTSWLDIKDATGASVLTMTGNDGATRTLALAPPLDLVVGNADHVDMTFRGERVDLAAHAKQNVARLQLR